MQPTQLPSFPAVRSSFFRHRLSVDGPRAPLSLNLSKPATPPQWASLPTPPMSGTPPPDPPLNPLQVAGRRRKREDSPSVTTGSALAFVSTTLPPLLEHAAHRYGEQPRAVRGVEETRMPSALAAPWEPPSHYGAGSSLGAGVYQSFLPPLEQSQISPRNTRKTKAHVASACVNCKKKHLRCDAARPCRRCVQSGKEDTCKDVEHKKRGRPPLKSDDSSSSARRSFPSSWQGTGFGGPGRPPSAAGTTYIPPSYPPLLPQPNPRLSLSFPPAYAAPSIAQSPAYAQGQFSVPPRFSPFPPGPPVQPGPPYGVLPHGPPAHGASQYAPQSLGTMPLVGSNLGALFPRTQAPSYAPPERPMGFDGRSNLQLPPIDQLAPMRPTQLNPPAGPAYTLRSPYHPGPGPLQMTQHGQTTSQPPQSTRAGGERGSKRPKMDIEGILGPRHD